jgi:hypothetical protein
VSAQVDLLRRREPAEREVGIRDLFADHEAGVGEVRLARHGGHPLVGRHLVEHEHGRRVPGERLLGERVDRAQPHQVGRLYSFR